jgi:hypothetical protein
VRSLSSRVPPFRAACIDSGGYDRDYDLWMLERMPVILILFDASRRRGYWLAVQGYFSEDAARRPKKGAKTVRVRVPKRQAVSRRAIATMRDLKWEARRRAIGGGS